MAGRTSDLTDNERRFVEEYLIDLNGVRAYLRTYGQSSYATASKNASLLLKKGKIVREIQAAQRDYAKRCNVKADKVIKETASVAFFDPIDLFNDDGTLRKMREIPLRSRRAIASVKVKNTPRWEFVNGERELHPDEVVTEIKFHPKMVAIGKLMDHLGLAQSITPLESFLALLDPSLADEVRAGLAEVVPGKATESAGTETAASDGEGI